MDEQETGEGPLWTSSWATVREQSAGLAQGLLPEDGALPWTQPLPQLRIHVTVLWPWDLLLAGDLGPSVGPLAPLSPGIRGCPGYPPGVPNLSEFHGSELSPEGHFRMSPYILGILFA